MIQIVRGLEPCKEIAPIDIEQLAIVADWRQELSSKLRRAQLRMEIIGLDADEADQLSAEVAAFKQVCRCLTRLREVA